MIVRQTDTLDDRLFLEFYEVIQRATGVQLPILEATELNNIPDDHVRILFGHGPLTDSLNIDTGSLATETYRIVTVKNFLVFTGTTADSYLWAISHYLDHCLGVRWLWPGDVGRYVPSYNSIPLPQLDIVARPRMEHRSLNPLHRSADCMHWLRMHMMGSRSTYRFGHAFTKWWERYGEKHPDFFAQPPTGQGQLPPELIKLNVSNEAIDEVVIQEWQDAGMPANWNVAPNDGSGFCVCQGCLAMDDPPDQSIDDIWRAEGQLTARYVSFWNRLLSKMRTLRPDVTLSSYAYNCYREPPHNGFTLHEGVVLGIVHTYKAYAQWRGWYEAGAKLFLRPNWWHSGAGAPYLLLHEMGDYFKFAHEHGMIGFNFDSILGYWGTQGLSYYLIARLSVRPELSVDDVIEEYVSAFGQAAPAIREYIQFWEQFSTQVAYNISAGNGISINPDGQYETIVREHDLPLNPLLGGWYTMPYLYTDEVIAQAKSLLQQAHRRAVHDDEYVRQRITFLEEGLIHLQLTRDVVRYGYEKTRPADATLDEFLQLQEQLDQFREQITTRHVIDHVVVQKLEERRKVPTHESRTWGWNDPSFKVRTGAELDEPFRGL